MDFTLFVCAGFFAQFIDGSLGMAYGVTANSLLLSFGLPPMIASSSVHLSEVFTTCASGISHFKLKNIDTKLFQRILVPGVFGGIIGAYLLTNISADIIRPWISVYLIIMGISILTKAFRKQIEKRISSIRAWILGLLGGFLDAIGGGGWGPIVTSTLVASGYNPRMVIGTVNTVEFFVTITQAATFITILGLTQNWRIILGMAIGGVIAAPFAAWSCKKISVRALIILIGLVIIVLNIRNLAAYLF